MGVLTESKTEILLKNGATLSRVHTGVSTIDDVADVEVDTDKIVKQTEVLIEHAGASLVAEEVIVSSVDEVLDTSIENA